MAIKRSIEEVLEEKMAKSKLLFDIQRFAPDEENEEDNEEESTEEVDTEEESTEEEDEDENSKFLKKKLKVMDQERQLELSKVIALEAKLEEQGSAMARMEELMSKVVENMTPVKKKTQAKTTAAEIMETTSKQILLSEVEKLKKQGKERDERDYINEQIKGKPWVEETIKVLKIATQDEYIRFILPQEDSLKEAQELKRKASDWETKDLTSEYGISSNRVSTDSKSNKIISNARAMGRSIISEVIN